VKVVEETEAVVWVEVAVEVAAQVVEAMERRASEEEAQVAAVTEKVAVGWVSVVVAMVKAA